MRKVNSKPQVRVFSRVILSALFALLLNTWVFGQEAIQSNDSVRIVTGVVKDAKSKQPIAAVQVSGLNFEASATTDANGAFSIAIPLKTEVLLVQAFDYSIREVAVQGKDSLEIELYFGLFTNLYGEKVGVLGKRRAAYLTNSQKSIEQFHPSTFASVDEVIQMNNGGDVRSITHSGVSGIGAAMFIRGYNSLNSNTQPLFVVDGVIWNSLYDAKSLHNGYFINALNDIDVNDIENLSIIKDGSSIYGSKGSNGVIIIETKRGRSMATEIEVNAMFGVVDQPKSLPMMDQDQFRVYSSDLIGTLLNFDTDKVDDFFPYLNDDPAKSTYNLYHNTTDWEDEVYQKGIRQNYNISVNGGDDKALYHFSMGYTGDKGVVSNTDMQRINTRFNTDIVLNKSIDLGLNIGFTNVDRNLLDDGVSFYTSPTYLALIKAPFLSPYEYTKSGTLTNSVEDADILGISNPNAIIENSLNASEHYRFNMGAKPTFKITDKIIFSNQFDYSLNKVKETYYSPMVGVVDRYMEGYGVSENMFRNQQIRNVGIFNDSRITYKNQWGLYHRLSAIAGFRYLSNKYESDFGEGHNSGSDQQRRLLFEETFKNRQGVNQQIVSTSAYANMDYSFDHRYFVTASVTVDGSSNFGSDTKEGFQLGERSYGVFPSLQAAWLVSSEQFMKSLNFVDQLKLRAGYSITGNDNINPYAWSAYFISTNYGGNANGTSLGNIGNSTIQWETTDKVNVALESILFNDRLALNVNAYRSYTKNLLTIKELPEVAGSGYYWDNEGELSNLGFEVSAHLKMLNYSNFKWEIGASVGHYENNIEALAGEDYVTSIYGADILTSVGNPAGLFYGYKSNGVFATQQEASTANLKVVYANGNETYFGAGDIHFMDVDGNGIINEADRQVIGDPNPDLYGSAYTNFTIKNFSINAMFTFSYGNDVYNHLRAKLESGDSFANQSIAMTNRWFYEGQQTEMPRASFNDPMGNARFSDRWIEDGSYVKLKSLTLNYKVPIKSGFLAGLNIWVSGNNLWTFSDYLGRDPEFSTSNKVLYQGIDTGLIPLTRSYFVGVKLNL